MKLKKNSFYPEDYLPSIPIQFLISRTLKARYKKMKKPRLSTNNPIFKNSNNPASKA